MIRPGQAVQPLPPVPPAFRGVWRRTLLEGPGIVTDVRSTVFWLQTADWHGDLRLPAGRPSFAACHALADTTPVQRQWLARQQGFAGITEVRPADHAAALGVPAGLRGTAALAPWCEWHRAIDFQPARGSRDLGVMVLAAAGTVVEEYGVDADYHETWVRLPHSTATAGAWERTPADPADPADAMAPRRELLLTAGSWFYHLRDRARPLAPAGEAADALDLALSFGCWNKPAGHGVVLHSTLPWLEGTLFVAGSGWAPVGAG